jgi:hypothetical protein
MNIKRITRNVWALTLSVGLGAILLLPVGGCVTEQKLPPLRKGVTKIGNLTVNNRLIGPRLPPLPQLPVVVTCNGGSTTITCPDGMTAACVGVVREFCK